MRKLAERGTRVLTVDQTLSSHVDLKAIISTTDQGAMGAATGACLGFFGAAYGTIAQSSRPCELDSVKASKLPFMIDPEQA